MSGVNRVLRYLSLWLRPPKIASVDVEELDQPTLPFVSPVFVLSTGRCGTKWLTELLRQDPRMWVNHSDYPELIRHSRLAYERCEKEPRVFQEIIRATRDGYILDAHNRSQTYVETNNRITFFAYAIQEVYPNARYIHLVRHPGDFVRSGVNRGWYHGGRHDVGRIRHCDSKKWKVMTNIEKIAWLWNETNQYIEDFFRTLESRQFLQVKAEDMWTDSEATAEICEFAGAEVGRQAITAMLDRRINRQRMGSMLPYQQWRHREKSELQQYILLDGAYGYRL
jgi:hypothetical protein